MLDSRRAEACSTDFEKVRRYVKRLCARLLPAAGGGGSEQIRLLSAITPQGPVFYSAPSAPWPTGRWSFGTSTARPPASCWSRSAPRR